MSDIELQAALLRDGWRFMAHHGRVRAGEPSAGTMSPAWSAP